MRYFLFTAAAAVMLWVLIGLLMDRWNEKLVRERKRLLALINDMRHQARAEGVDFHPKTEFNVDGNEFSADDIGMDEDYARQQVEDNIVSGKHDPICRLATEENLRSWIFRFFLFSWPRAVMILCQQSFMLKVFKGHVEELLPHILQLSISKKKMLERRAS
jgi:hypothetical protein